jgi:tape measure domain-containing protein
MLTTLYGTTVPARQALQDLHQELVGFGEELGRSTNLTEQQVMALRGYIEYVLLLATASRNGSVTLAGLSAAAQAVARSLSEAVDSADLATPLGRAVLQAEKLIDALRRLGDEGVLTVNQLGELASIENQLSVKDIGLEEVSGLNDQLGKLITSAEKAKEALAASGQSTAALTSGLSATGDAAAATEMDLADAKAALGDMELAQRLMGKSGTQAAAEVKKMAETSANTASAVSGLQAVSQAAGESERKLYGAAKAAHEAKVARDALKAAGGAGGAGIPPVPPTTMAGGPGGMDPDDLRRQLAALMGQLGAVKAGVAGAAGPLNAAAGAAGAVAGAAAAAGAAAGGAVPPIRNVGAAAGGAAGGFNNMAAGANNAASATQRAGFMAQEAANRSSFLNRTLSMAFAFSGGVAVTNVLSFLTDAVAGFNSRLEQAHIGLQTMLGDADEADEFIQDLLRFAEVTPFEFKGLLQAVQSMQAMGFAAEDTLPILRSVGDAVAAQGKGQEYIDRVTRALGQMLTAGKVRAQDMRQLTEAGIPAWEMLAESMGKTTSELQKMSEQGLVPAQQGIEAIVNGMSKDFGGMMAKQARTAAGALSTIRDAALQTVSGAVKPAFDAISETMVALADFFIGGGGKYITPVIQAIAITIVAVLIPALNGMAASAAAASISIAGISLPLVGVMVMLSTFALAWQENFAGIRSAVEPVVKGIVEALSGLFDALGGTATLVPALTVAIGALAVVITAKLVVAIVSATVATIAYYAGLILLVGALNGTTVSATLAAAAVSMFWAAVAAPLTLVIALATAVGLLVLNFDQVAQGARVAAWSIVAAIKWIADAASSVPIIGEVFKGVAEQLGVIQNEIERDMASAEASINAKKAALAAPVAEDPWKEWKGNWSKAMSEITESTESMVEKFGYSMEAVAQAAAEAGGEAMAEMAKAIRDHQNEPLQAFIELKDMLANQMLPATEIARLYGMLTAQEIAQGLASGDPAVVAQTEALVKYIETRLDELTDGAYSAGRNTTWNFANGMVDQTSMAALGAALQRFGTPFTTFIDKIAGTNLTGWLTSIVAQMQKPVQVSNDWNTKWKPSADAVADAMKGVNAELMKTSAYTSALSALNSAFSEIRSAANRYFDEHHRRALEAIEDARKQKNAILDAKAALVQAPVTAAQRALDFQRRQIEEWRLREAVKNATDPAARRDAILALQDFLAQSHIDEMQQQADAAKDIYDAQKDANDQAADLAKEAENERYENQKEAFERELEQLRLYLEKHPGEWTSTNEKVLALLNDYGIDYKNAGSLLGEWFVVGLQEQVAAAEEAARQLAGALLIETGAPLPTAGMTPPGLVAEEVGGQLEPAPTTTPTTTPTIVPTGGQPTAGPIHLQAGLWHNLANNLLAILHPNEMVAPPYIASLIRELGQQSSGPATNQLPIFGAIPAMMGRDQEGSLNRTIIFQVGDERLGEITDRAMYNQDSIYSRHVLPSTGSLR